MRHTGGIALSAFRIEKLLRAAQQQCASLLNLKAHHVHFVKLAEALTEEETEKLKLLLNYPAAGKDELPSQDAFAAQLLTIPRLGTISPWSSKATEIARSCGFIQLKQIERGILWTLFSTQPLEDTEINRIKPLLFDRMTETVIERVADAEETLFKQTTKPRPLRIVPLSKHGKPAVVEANRQLGLALTAEEIDYLAENFQALKRDPSDVELMMFAQVNSEHCRHKIFNAAWIIDEQPQPHSLFEMIRHTHQQHPGKVLSAYQDNAAILSGFPVERFAPARSDGRHPPHYIYTPEERHILMKVETHNHPTAISPFAGAATGSGGEIRDEGATGRGATPKAGLTGFSVSHLRIPGFHQPWEDRPQYPKRIATALEIMLEGPIGASSFNNEFGRPALCGYFRAFEMEFNGERRGYHKPIMLAGGVGNIRPQHLHKNRIAVESPLVVIGGPAMLIGLGGGAASSMSSGHSDAELDFASVQRSNPEMQRRCQEVIESCARLGAANPIISIHDVGAGGLSNALPELVHASSKGGRFKLRSIPTADLSLSPLELWCNESQERYVLAIAKEQLSLFINLCERERCPYAVVGEATLQPQLIVADQDKELKPVDMPLSVLLGNPPKMQREVERLKPAVQPLKLQWCESGGEKTEEDEKDCIDLMDAALLILRFPSVASKSFLITIGDRTVGGLSVRDQMVGPWQIPVADCAVTASSFKNTTGEAMAIGERAPLALVDAPASGRMAVGEAITNLCAAPIDSFNDIVLSANWMAACGHPGEDAKLFDTVKAVAMELCPTLGIAIPVGKDSLSMKTVWQDGSRKKSVTAPLSLIISAFARVSDIRRCLTPQLQNADSALLLLDLGRKKNRLGGSVLAQVYKQFGDKVPDLDRAEDLKSLFIAIQTLNKEGKILAYHDRSDGGLFATLCEMAFAGHCGLDVNLDALGPDVLASLFNEELGAVIQVPRREVHDIILYFVQQTTLAGQVHLLGYPNDGDILSFHHNKRAVLALPREELYRAWNETSYQMQRLRDNPECAQESFDALTNNQTPKLSLHATFQTPASPAVAAFHPRLAVLREQGVNGQLEMAAAFERAGFDCVDVHLSDILSGRAQLKDFQGLAACGGFSYGDVLGAGGGWAKSIRFNPRAFDEFSEFFNRPDTFALGVCNGCQMMAQLQDLIPGAAHWPIFTRNRSEQFEARLSMVEIPPSPSLFFQNMAGSRLPVVVSHGEGQAEFAHDITPQQILEQHLVTLRYIDNQGQVTEKYPFNPNGSPLGITGLTTADGRFTIMMPHPERLFLRNQYSWLPPEWKSEEGPWFFMFQNARRWMD